MMISYGIRQHCGSLNESLRFSKLISESTFKNFLYEKSFGFKYYAFDKRCNQILFLGIIDNCSTWLFIQINGGDKK